MTERDASLMEQYDAPGAPHWFTPNGERTQTRAETIRAAQREESKSDLCNNEARSQDEICRQLKDTQHKETEEK